MASKSDWAEISDQINKETAPVRVIDVLKDINIQIEEAFTSLYDDDELAEEDKAVISASLECAQCDIQYAITQLS